MSHSLLVIHRLHDQAVSLMRADMLFCSRLGKSISDLPLFKTLPFAGHGGSFISSQQDLDFQNSLSYTPGCGLRHKQQTVLFPFLNWALTGYSDCLCLELRRGPSAGPTFLKGQI